MARRGSILATAIVLVVQLAGFGRSAAAAAQVDGATYSSPTYGWSLAWDDTWTVDDEWSRDGHDALVLFDGLGTAYFDAYEGFDGDPEACVEAERQAIEEFADDGEVEIARNGEGEPIQGSDLNGAYAVYVFSLTDGEGVRFEIVEYSDCRTLVEDEAVLEITQVTVREAYNEAVPAFQELLANLAMPREDPADEPDGEIRSAPESQDDDLSERQAKSLVADIEDDLTDWWTDVFADHDLFYVEPFFVVVEEEIEAPCSSGEIHPGTGSFYCPLNQTIYFDLSTELEDADGFGRSSVYYTMGHEAGHDVQMQLGIALSDTSSVEMELEADCMAGAYLAHAVDEDDLTEDEFFDLLDLVDSFGDPKGVPATADGAHGLGSQRVSMVLRGYFSGVDACGTF
jgi:uncharacterized protein